MGFSANDNHPLTNDTYDWDDPNLTFRLQTNAGELVLILDSCAGKISSGLERQTCPFCGSQPPNCNFDCDESEDQVRDRLRYNAFLDALESLALAHAKAGIDVCDPRYVVGLNAALDAAGNNL